MMKAFDKIADFELTLAMRVTKGEPKTGKLTAVVAKVVVGMLGAFIILAICLN